MRTLLLFVFSMQWNNRSVYLSFIAVNFIPYYLKCFSVICKP